MGFIGWIIFSVGIGIIATILDSRQRNGGFIGGIILSITGTFLALFLSSLIFNLPTSLNVTTALIAIYGASIFLLTGRSLRQL